MRVDGWNNIKKVSVQYFTEMVPCGDGLYTEQVVDIAIWIECKGSVFLRTLGIGENEEKIADYYRERGYTDDEVMFFGSTKN